MQANKKIQHYIKPMLATAVDKPFNNNEWLFELKLDGYRAITDISDGKLSLYSRNGINMLPRYPSVAHALKRIKTNVILDGEIVLLDEKGKPDFQKLQNYQANKQYPLTYYVFDILSLKNQDLKSLPLIERKQLLKKLLKNNAAVRYYDHIEEHGIDFFKKIKEQNLEGIIAKKKDSYYIQGIRTREWLKIKNHKSQEAMIVGFTAPKRSRLHFGSILLAQYKKGKLQYIGHAGTGFTDRSLKELMQKMKQLITKNSPFEENIKTNGPVTWIKPELVCEIGFYEITQNGILRHPVFKRLRTDKKAGMVKAETEKSLPVKKVIQSLK